MLNSVDVLQKYQEKVENSIKHSIAGLGPKTKLRDACEYALLNGGKRLRPALVFMIADALGHHVDVANAALSIEYFHTASLIADDLPCMDNDDERRNKPSVHKVFGEEISLLASYALIASGYEKIALNAAEIEKAKIPLTSNSDYLGMLALSNATFNTGLLGATGGQFLDIFPPDLTLPTLRDVIHKKTISLFEVAFVFGWLFGGGNPDQLALVKKCASHFGMAFQIADDIGDRIQDSSKGRRVNMALVFGVESAIQMFHEEIEQYRVVLSQLLLDSPDLHSLEKWLQDQVDLDLAKA